MVSPIWMSLEYRFRRSSSLLCISRHQDINRALSTSFAYIIIYFIEKFNTFKRHKNWFHSIDKPDANRANIETNTHQNCLYLSDWSLYSHRRSAHTLRCTFLCQDWVPRLSSESIWRTQSSRLLGDEHGLCTCSEPAFLYSNQWPEGSTLAGRCQPSDYTGHPNRDLSQD